MDNIFAQKGSGTYFCKICNYNTIRKSQYDRHISTRKHLSTTKYIEAELKKSEAKKFRCECGKEYPYRSSLYNHKKKCNFNELDIGKENQILKTDDEILDYKDMFMTIMNENKELRDMLISQHNQISELIPKVGNNNNSNNTIHNKQKFNVNVFLNEQCKDALTMKQFIEDIKISLEDLFITKNKGITEGVSNIFIKNMNKLSLHERPIHCTDVKRETVYIKSEGDDGEEAKWEKDKEQEKLKEAINEMTYVQSKNLKLYTDKNPDWMDKEHKQDEYMIMVKNSMDDIKKDNRVGKVVKKVCNNVYYNGEE